MTFASTSISLYLLAAKSLQSCPTLCDPIDWTMQATRLPRPWDSPGKNTGVGCHFLLQCIKVQSEREVTQSCPTLRLHGLQPTRLLRPWDFPHECWSGLPSPSLSPCYPCSMQQWVAGIRSCTLLDVGLFRLFS